MTHLYLIRHGEAVSNVEPIIGGMQGDSGLTPLGVAQAEALRDRLLATREIAADVLIASTLPRARQTAEIIYPAFGDIPFLLDDDLHELRPGEADGMHVADFKAKYGTPDFRREPFKPLSPGGENWPQFMLRVVMTIRGIVAEHENKTIVAVCHGGVIDGSLITASGMSLLAIPPLDFFTLNTSITHWEFRSFEDETARWRLHSYNDATHIRAIGRNDHVRWRDIPPSGQTEDHTSIPLPTEDESQSRG